MTKPVKPKRFHLTVTMQEDMLREVQAHCAERDLPITVWCRDAIKSALAQQRDQSSN